jgi:hypothetical protein
MASLEGVMRRSSPLWLQRPLRVPGHQAPTALPEPERCLRGLVKRGRVGTEVHALLARSRSFIGLALNDTRQFAVDSFSIARSTR